MKKLAASALLIIGFATMLSLALPAGRTPGIWAPPPRVKWTNGLSARVTSWAAYMCAYVAIALAVVTINSARPNGA